MAKRRFSQAPAGAAVATQPLAAFIICNEAGGHSRSLAIPLCHSENVTPEVTPCPVSLATRATAGAPPVGRVMRAGFRSVAAGSEPGRTAGREMGASPVIETSNRDGGQSVHSD